MIKIGWCPWMEMTEQTETNSQLNYYGWADLAAFEPEPIDIWSKSDSRFTICPAFHNYNNQTFMLRSWIDVEIQWDKYNKVFASNIPGQEHRVLIKPHHTDFNPESGVPIVAIANSYLFVADEPVVIEFMPAYYHHIPGLRLISGSFNIGAWQRPVVPTFEMTEDRVKIRRGQPLAYVRFRSKNLRDTFKLVKIDRTDEVNKLVDSCLSLKKFIPNLSWQIAQWGWNKIRPRKLVK